MSDGPNSPSQLIAEDGAATLRAYTDATREIMRVVAESRHDEQPVLAAVLDAICELCDVPFAVLGLCNENRTHLHVYATRTADKEFADWIKDNPLPMDERLSTAARAVLGTKVIQIRDQQEFRNGQESSEHFRRATQTDGQRTFLAVPLILDGTGIGALLMYRQEVRLFAEEQIDLIKTFADQAVIAIENARQFRELETRLEREAATKDILQVISQSRDDEQLVFNTILERSAAICDAQQILLALIDESLGDLPIVAHLGGADDYVAQYNASPFTLADTTYQSVEAMLKCKPLQTLDALDTELYREGDSFRKTSVELGQFRTFLSVPLVRGDKSIGVMVLFRQEVRAFAPDQIVLLQTFADQAVIAIENARQFRELQTRLEREAATREILSVISQSRDDENPVFDVILESAARLCDCRTSTLVLLNEASDRLVLRAMWGEPMKHFKLGQELWRLDGATGNVRAVHERRIIHIEDMADTEEYRNGNPIRGGERSMMKASAPSSLCLCWRMAKRSAVLICSGTRCARSTTAT